MMHSFIIRPLTAQDVSDYRAMRRYIHEIGDGKYFADSYEREAALTEQGWREWCTEQREHCIIGISDGQGLIGSMMATQHQNAWTVEWEAIWLHPTYRGRGVAKLCYQQLEHWTLAKGYQHVALYIRSDNERSQSIHIKNGAEYINTKSGVLWADGSVAAMDCFRLDLSAATMTGRAKKQRVSIANC